MRFCPFCSAENLDEASRCLTCGKDLPLPARPGTGKPVLPTAPAPAPPRVAMPAPSALRRQPLPIDRRPLNAPLRRREDLPRAGAVTEENTSVEDYTAVDDAPPGLAGGRGFMSPTFEPMVSASEELTNVEPVPLEERTTVDPGAALVAADERTERAPGAEPQVAAPRGLPKWMLKQATSLPSAAKENTGETPTTSPSGLSFPAELPLALEGTDAIAMKEVQAAMRANKRAATDQAAAADAAPAIAAPGAPAASKRTPLAKEPPRPRKPPTAPPPLPSAALRARKPTLPPPTRPPAITAPPSPTAPRSQTADPSPADPSPQTADPRPPAASPDFGNLEADISEIPMGPQPRTPTTPPATEPAVASSPASPTPGTAIKQREPTHVDPPPTRVNRTELAALRPFTPPTVIPVPSPPDPGLLNHARYAAVFLRARWQRRGAIRTLHHEIALDTAALDQVLGTLGRVARDHKVDYRAITAENQGIDADEAARDRIGVAQNAVLGRQEEETAKFREVELEWQGKITAREYDLHRAQNELSQLEGQRRALRDRLKETERRQKTYLKAAEERDAEAGKAPMGTDGGALRRQAEDHRREAASLEPERQDIERKISALDRPISESSAAVEAGKTQLEAARSSLHDAREGHRHRLAELQGEHSAKGRELAAAEAAIGRRMVTLGTLINLNRIDRPDFVELFGRIDRIRDAITARTAEIEKLTAERAAFDREKLTRGLVVIGGAAVVLIAVIAIILALL